MLSLSRENFTETEVFEKILSLINSRDVDVVISDMAPNMSGVKAVDQPKAMYLAGVSLRYGHASIKRWWHLCDKIVYGRRFRFIC